MEKLPENYGVLPKLPKKRSNLKKIFIVITILSILLTFLAYAQYTKTDDYQLNKVMEEVNNMVESGELKEVEVTRPDQTILNPLTSVNPRHSYINLSNDEFFFIAHDGSAGGIGNITLRTSGSGYGFFNYIGSSASKIIKGWFTDLQVDNGVNATNYTGTQYCNATSCYTVTQFLADTDTQKTTSGRYIYNNTNTIFINETQLNETIDNRDSDTTYINGSGLSLVGVEFNHTDTSSQASSDNSGRTYIQDILLDTFGHITSILTATETVLNYFTLQNNYITNSTTAGINITSIISSGNITHTNSTGGATLNEYYNGSCWIKTFGSSNMEWCP